MKVRRLSTFLLSLAFVLYLSSTAYAYIDPGTASMILQGLVALVAGTLVTIRLYWRQIKAFFGKNTSENALKDK
jgi:hypothetical protein